MAAEMKDVGGPKPPLLGTNSRFPAVQPGTLKSFATTALSVSFIVIVTRGEKHDR
jgi:hypothetical protein